MLGRPEVVSSGQAGMVLAGTKSSLDRCRPLFEAIARRTFDAGPDPVAAAAIKIANNFVLGCAIEAMGEGFALVRKYDVAPEVFLDVMTDGLFACSAYKVYGKIIAEQRYQPAGQRAVLGLKDANLALAAGEAVGVPLPSGNVWRDRLVGAVAHGEGEHDWAVMAKDQARASGLEYYRVPRPGPIPREQGKLQGKWLGMHRAKALLACLIGQEIQSLSQKIPYPREQGICWRETGNSIRPNGEFRRPEVLDPIFELGRSTCAGKFGASFAASFLG